MTLRPKSLAICGRGWKATKLGSAARAPTREPLQSKVFSTIKRAVCSPHDPLTGPSVPLMGESVPLASLFYLFSVGRGPGTLIGRVPKSP